MMSLASYFLQLQGILLFLIIPTVYGDCAYDGKTFKAYTVVYKIYDAANDWCFVGLCAHNGNIWKLVDLNCRRRSSTGNTIDSGKMTSTAATTTTPTATTPVRCMYEGKEYSPGSEIFRGLDEVKMSCYTLVCTQSGDIVTRDKKRCRTKKPPTERITSTDDATTRSEFNTAEKITTVSSPEYSSTTHMQRTTEPPPTTAPTTAPTTPPGCYENGKFYLPGSKMSEGYDEATDWCYGTICDESGSMINWDTWNCKGRYTSTEFPTTSSPPPTTAPKPRFPTTEPSTIDVATPPVTTIPPGCFYNDKYYRPGDYITKMYDEASDWCHGTYCNERGEIISWDDWNCKRGGVTTAPPTTAPPTTAPPTTAPLIEIHSITTPPPTTAIETTVPHRFGCYENGRFYQPGERVSEQYDEDSDWCHGLYCDEDGELVNWDTWNCKRSATTAPPRTTTTDPTTIPTTADEITSVPTTLPIGCSYDTLHYNTGEMIYEKYDAHENWCYGLVCSEGGQLVYWDKWNCKQVSTPPALQTIATSYISVKTDIERESAVLCLYEGVKYTTRQFIKKDCSNNGKCSVLFCNHKGIVVPKILSDMTRNPDSSEDTYIFQNAR